VEILQNNYCSISINHFGFIESSIIGGITFNSPAYLVFFKDYSRTDPSCRAWNMDSPIANIHRGPDWVSYTKQIESVQIEVKIELDEYGWTWHISIKNETPLHHRFGVAIPWQEGRLASSDGEVLTPVSQYSTSVEQIFHDQTLLSVPMLIKEAENQDHIILGDIRSSYHFFCYIDGVVPYCRSTHSTSRSRDMTISFGILPSNQAKEYYIKKYPVADQLINRWRPLLKEIEQKYAINITYSPNDEIIERSDTLISFKSPTLKQLERYTTQLSLELSKYPASFFTLLDLNAIFLTRNIVLRNEKQTSSCAGCAFGSGDTSFRWIIIDISQNDQELLHHEIYHILARKLNPNFAGDKEEFYASEFGKLMIGSGNNVELKDEVLQFCPKIAFPNSHNNSQIQIWSRKEGQIEMITFGDLPHNSLGMDFVHDKKLLS
jgi:hypothetical protein